MSQGREDLEARAALSRGGLHTKLLSIAKGLCFTQLGDAAASLDIGYTLDIPPCPVFGIPPHRNKHLLIHLVSRSLPYRVRGSLCELVEGYERGPQAVVCPLIACPALDAGVSLSNQSGQEAARSLRPSLLPAPIENTQCLRGRRAEADFGSKFAGFSPVPSFLRKQTLRSLRPSPIRVSF